ncbi:uncharacterized protein G2W53_018504 [Senna tora]|uniref:Uncharacterized protein n=1 Tax=Senna tora TaxID=362788 RepID=A0A834TRX4_9FABA|nr:uncharacterized protein G2W53_018504 [Senna tora]
MAACIWTRVGSWCHFLTPPSGRRGLSSDQLPLSWRLKRTAIRQEMFFFPPTPHPLSEPPLVVAEKETENPSFTRPFD